MGGLHGETWRGEVPVYVRCGSMLMAGLVRGLSLNTFARGMPRSFNGVGSERGGISSACGDTRLLEVGERVRLR